ncbi:DUF1266 domain-containing protein [Natronospirillum operosum]|uniref:DUF1266 domain-containing protein n=1 Tax=Natronospirillum operosum TaxID=2759953 RepID=A0A4Z0W4K6_9GAMM|nr:DUF1266 domain-containing protein [Natronospirillum operosum]TGG92447.1 DUF1266 domain-containing protein [Natronospirillum operosum]
MNERMTPYLNSDKLSDTQLWLLAPSAMLTVLNAQRHDMLFPLRDEDTPEDRADTKRCLDQDWDVTDAKTLAETVEFLHQAPPLWQAMQGWHPYSSDEYQVLHQGDWPDSLKNLLTMVEQYGCSMPAGDLAWHLGRCAWVVRSACQVGYIDEDDAWKLLTENGNRIARAFNSWAEFGMSYAIGAQYFRSQRFNAESIQRYRSHLTTLLTHPDSPWVRLPWEAYTPEDVEEAVSG